MPVGTAGIVAHLPLDAGSVAAAVLHAVPDCLEHAAEQLEKSFGKDISTLVDAAWRMRQILKIGETGAFEDDEKASQLHIESLRKMLLAMVEDIRVVLLKLAERTHALRSAAKSDEAARRAVAREIQDIYAPLANRLGVWQIKWEMEDLSFRFLEPELYKKIAKLLDEKRVDRENYIAAVIARLKEELAHAGIRAEVTGRPKHIYSIYKKMKRKGVDFSDVYDVRAVRVLVDSLGDCYAALGIAHNLWQPIPKEFDDYIAHPKGNFYRSLHTAVIGPEDKALEVQIRTHDMHNHAELGVAAHWRYKEGGKGDARFEEKIAWLRQILEWKDDVRDAGEILEQFKTGLLPGHPLRVDAAGQGDRPALRIDADRFRLPPAHRSRPSLPRRQGGRQYRAAHHQAGQRPAGRDYLRQAGRPQPRLAQRQPGLRGERARQGQDTPLVQVPAL